MAKINYVKIPPYKVSILFFCIFFSISKILYILFYHIPIDYFLDTRRNKMRQSVWKENFIKTETEAKSCLHLYGNHPVVRLVNSIISRQKNRDKLFLSTKKSQSWTNSWRHTACFKMKIVGNNLMNFVRCLDLIKKLVKIPGNGHHSHIKQKWGTNYQK